VLPTESLTEFGLPEWIRTLKARLVEISDLDMKYQTCSTHFDKFAMDERGQLAVTKSVQRTNIVVYAGF